MIPVTLRPDILSTRHRQYAMPEGLSLREIAEGVPDLPAGFWTHGVIAVNGNPVPCEYWQHVRPKTANAGREIVVTLHMVPGKGGQLLTIIASIALLTLTTAISGGLLAPVLGAGFAAGTLGASVAGAAIGIAGQLLISALVPPPKQKDKDARDPVSAGVSGNTATPLSLLQRVAGKMHVSPPFLAWPYTYLIGQDVFVEAVVGLAGNHLIENLRVNDTDIDENDTIDSYETREGTGTEADITISNQTVVEERPGLSMSTFKLDHRTGHRDELDNQITPDVNKPKWHSFNMRGEGDEARFRLFWPSGIEHVSRADQIGVAIRLQFRALGTSAWTNGPELHFKDPDKIIQEYRQEIKVKFDAGPVVAPADRAFNADTLTSFAFWSAAPAMAWAYAADSYFDPGTGELLADHVTMDESGFTIWLDPASFPRGEYEFRVMRSLSYEVGHMTTTGLAYNYNGGTTDANFFDYYLTGGGVATVRIGQINHSTITIVESFATIDDAYPLPAQTEVPMTLIAVKVKNGTINSISADFTSRVNTWNGADWNTLEPSQNPAALFRHFRLDDISASPLDPSLLDTANIEDWYDYCVAQGYECNAVISGSIDEALALTAAAGWAVPRQSETVGVIVEKDRSGESPVQIFTPINSQGYKARKAFTDLPHAVYAEFYDETHRYTLKTRTVYGDGWDAFSATLFDTIRYESITDPDQIDARALMDWRQLQYRQTKRSITIGAEHLMSGRGDLVALAHDVVGTRLFFGLVDRVVDNGVNVTGIVLVATMPLADAGGACGVAIRCEDGTTIEAAINETTTTKTLTFVTPFAIPAGGILDVGCLVAGGLVGLEYQRCVILGIKRRGALRAELTLVDEAPQIHESYLGIMDYSTYRGSQLGFMV